MSFADDMKEEHSTPQCNNCDALLLVISDIEEINRTLGNRCVMCGCRPTAKHLKTLRGHTPNCIINRLLKK